MRATTAIGIDVSKYANDLAAVHTILKRLNASGELRFIPSGPGKHQYAWNRPTTPVALGRDIVSVMHDATHEREATRATAVPQDRGDDEELPPRARRTRRARKTR